IELAGSTPAGVAARYAAAVSGRSAERSAPGAKPNGSGSAAGVAKRSRKTVRPGSATDRPSTLAGASASATRLSGLGQSHGSSTAALPTAFPGTCLSFGDGGGVWVVGRRKNRDNPLPLPTNHRPHPTTNQSGQDARLDFELGAHLLDQDVHVERLGQ